MKITILQALGISGVAMAIILCVLAAIMLLIYLMSAFMKKTEGFKFSEFFARFSKNKKADLKEVSENEISDTPTLAKGSAGDIKLYNVSDKDAALIMAIVADTTGIPLNQLRFKSIREVKGE